MWYYATFKDYEEAKASAKEDKEQGYKVEIERLDGLGGTTYKVWTWIDESLKEEKINYNVDDNGVLHIYLGDKILSDVSDCGGMDDHHLLELVADTLYGLGYDWKEDGTISKIEESLKESQEEHVEYVVLSVDWDEMEWFDNKEEAIAFAESHEDAGEVLEIHSVTTEDGEDEYLDDKEETIWLKEEALKESEGALTGDAGEYSVVKSNDWYDPEGLDIPSKAETIFTGDEKSCHDFLQKKREELKKEYADRDDISVSSIKERKELDHLEKEGPFGYKQIWKEGPGTQYFEVYFRSAIAKDYYTVVRNVDNKKSESYNDKEPKEGASVNTSVAEGCKKQLKEYNLPKDAKPYKVCKGTEYYIATFDDADRAMMGNEATHTIVTKKVGGDFDLGSASGLDFDSEEKAKKWIDDACSLKEDVSKELEDKLAQIYNDGDIYFDYADDDESEETDEGLDEAISQSITIYEKDKDGVPEVGREFIAYASGHRKHGIFKRVDKSKWEKESDAKDHISSDGEFYAEVEHDWIYGIDFDSYAYVDELGLKSSSVSQKETSENEAKKAEALNAFKKVFGDKYAEKLLNAFTTTKNNRLKVVLPFSVYNGDLDINHYGVCDHDDCSVFIKTMVKKGFTEAEAKDLLRLVGEYNWTNKYTNDEIKKIKSTSNMNKLLDSSATESYNDNKELKEDASMDLHTKLKHLHNVWFDVVEKQNGAEFIIFQDWKSLIAVEKALKPGFEPKDKYDTSVLDELNIDYGFSNEWSACDNCGKLIRTEPNSYSWVPDFFVDNEKGEIICGDCVRKDPRKYLETLYNNPEVANTILSESDLEEQGFEKIGETYESGWYDRNDSPEEILSKALEEHPNGVFIFSVSSQGQFATQFELWGAQLDMDERLRESNGGDVFNEMVEFIENELNHLVIKGKDNENRILTCYWDNTLSDFYLKEMNGKIIFVEDLEDEDGNPIDWNRLMSDEEYLKDNFANVSTFEEFKEGIKEEDSTNYEDDEEGYKEDDLIDLGEDEVPMTFGEVLEMFRHRLSREGSLIEDLDEVARKCALDYIKEHDGRKIEREATR